MERTGRRTQALALYEQAIQRGEKALELNRQDDLARPFQVSHHANLGTLLTGLGRRAEAEAHLRRAVALGEQVVAAVPAPDYRRELALSQTRLGLWLAELGRWGE